MSDTKRSSYRAGQTEPGLSDTAAQAYLHTTSVIQFYTGV